jgi:serine/threonine protein kinase
MLNLNLPGIKNGFYNRYKLIKPINSGRYGTVYLTNNMNLDKLFAVKILPCNRGDLGTFNNSAMLTNEISNLKKLRGLEHHITRLIDVYKDDGDYLVVMDLYDGVYVKNKSHHVNSEAIVSKIAAHMCFALHACHINNVCHNDLKPSNIFLDVQQDQYVLGDFGSSFNIQSGTMNFIGTPFYASPEKYQGSFGLPSDIWALGIMVYFLIFNHHPFIQDHMNITSSMVFNENNILWHDTNIITKECKDFIEVCLIKDSNKRAVVDDLVWHPFVRKHALSQWPI